MPVNNSVLLLLITCHLFSPASSIPVRGNYPWTVLLCKFYDIADEPKNASYFHYWLLDLDHEASVARYFQDISNGMYSIKGSNIHGWYSMPYRRQAVEFLASRDEKLNALYPDTSKTNMQLKVYHKTKQLCVETARNNGMTLYGRTIIIVNDQNIAMYCREEGVLLTPHFLATAALAHEMVHSFYIGHSYSDRAVRVFPYSGLGEYDDTYDLMSTANAYMYETKYGLNGPGLNGPHLDYLGWLPLDRTLFFGRDSYNEATLRLASLSMPSRKTKGWLLIFLPYDRDNSDNFYTVELRTRSGHDQGVKRDAIIIHKVTQIDGYLYSYLITNAANRRYEWLPGDRFFTYLDSDRQTSIEIDVLSIDGSSGSADVKIRSSFSPTRCKNDERLRNAFQGDTVCVSNEEFSKIQAEKEENSKFVGPIGTCLGGRVHRRSGPADTTCVTWERKLVSDGINARWKTYERFLSLDTWGLNSCQEGYIWRALDFHDYACVTREYRALLASQGSDNCTSSPDLVRRYLFSTDIACVTPQQRDEAQSKSFEARKKLKYYKFFNGVDDVR